jgi:hypothetical protein
MPKEYHFYKLASKMLGPRPLTEREISLDKYNGSGNYLLCDETSTSYKVKYVGRGILKDRLKRGLNEGYTHFYYIKNSTKIKSFTKECQEFHRYGKANDLDNTIHPAKPEGYSKKCTEIGCKGEKN